jgi:hypothetical protein
VGWADQICASHGVWGMPVGSWKEKEGSGTPEDFPAPCSTPAGGRARPPLPLLLCGHQVGISLLGQAWGKVCRDRIGDGAESHPPSPSSFFIVSF